MTVPSTQRRRGRGGGLLLAELGLLAVHLSVVVGFGRLYDDRSYLPHLAAFPVVAHLLALTGRRLRLPTPAVVALGIGGAVLTSSWVLFVDTLSAGLPTGATLDAARAAIDVAGAEFREVAAPTAPLPGFQLLAGLALWGAVWFADWTAFRLRTTAEAIAPAAILFAFCTVLGTGESRFAAAVLFAAAVVVFVANHRALLSEFDSAWLASTPSEGADSIRRAALGVGAVVVVAGAVLAPLTPGYDEEPIVRWRSRGTDAGLRTTVSPIVDLRRRLVSQSDRVLFEVESDVEAYWRLTSLHEFDGEIWSSGGNYGDAEAELPSEGGLVPRADIIEQRIEVRALAAIWAPVAFEARVLRGSNRGLSWDPDSSTLIVDASSDDSDGLEYQVTSRRPVLDEGILRGAVGPDPASILDRYIGLPVGFPELASTEAQRAVAAASGRYEQAMALQDYFRNGTFSYSTDIAAGHGNDALTEFLLNRVGYCEQFAGAYAAMARSLGIPARVAIGFTPGDPDPVRPSVRQVKGLHAHAWPEVYFAGVGWVPFEPTPGRGMPGAEAYTGLPPAQDTSFDAPAPTTTTTTTAPTPTTTDPGAAPPPTTTPPDAPVQGTDLGGSDPEPPSRARIVLLWAAGLVALWLTLVLAAPRLRAAVRGSGAPPRRAVLDAWDDAVHGVRWLTGMVPRTSETHLEFAHRAAPALDVLSGPVTDLADLAARAAWAPEPVTGSDAARAGELARNVQHGAMARQSTGQRIRRRLSWREAFGRTPTAGQASSSDRRSSPENPR